MSYTAAMNENQNIKSKLTPSEIQRYKAILLAKRAEILGNVTVMEHETLLRERNDLSSMPIHMADLGTDSYEQEFTLGLMDSERKVIAEIDFALNRIEEGTYGICEVGGELITKQRLEAIPWAKFCVGCAGLIEKGIVKKNDHFHKYNYVRGIDDEKDVELDNLKIEH
jgi:RNA polymerase-binding protein DksA